MLPTLLGKKVGMTQVYDADGVLHPVTVVQAGPCAVLQIKSADSDGYDAIQLGFDESKPRRVGKPLSGHAAKSGAKPVRFIREARLDAAVEGVEAGQTLTVEVFAEIPWVDVQGTTKGKGFAGGMKRHHFGGQPATHGTERKHRSPGSIGGHASNRGTGKIKKGKRMAGHMGAAQRTTRKHRLVGVDKENNLLLIQGSVPGANGGYVVVRASKTAGVKA